MENKNGMYFKYAVGEIVLVVIGILIELQINNWNENVKKLKQEKIYYCKIKDDLESDKINIKRINYTSTYFCNLIYRRKKNKEPIRRSDHEMFIGCLFALMKLKIIQNDESNGYLIMPKKK